MANNMRIWRVEHVDGRGPLRYISMNWSHLPAPWQEDRTTELRQFWFRDQPNYKYYFGVHKWDLLSTWFPLHERLKIAKIPKTVLRLYIVPRRYVKLGSLQAAFIRHEAQQALTWPISAMDLSLKETKHVGSGILECPQQSPTGFTYNSWDY